ncbi:amino acid adenylation domain-containing protein [Streptomyces sp. NPDC001595]|uniref:amino acid adenylation domain-containing protein n=1 Tax=Streptomyces sp. NPDC001532 TaxID=3154520 RepID=UPI003321C3A7
MVLHSETKNPAPGAAPPPRPAAAPGLPAAGVHRVPAAGARGAAAAGAHEVTAAGGRGVTAHGERGVTASGESGAASGAHRVPDVTVHGVFEQRVRESPDAVAVALDDVRLTYGETDRLANRLAHRLSAMGVGAEARVGVLLEPSAELVVALLGILKAGAAYVPLDPDYPPDRLTHLLRDSGAEVVLTRPHLEPRLGAADVRRVGVDTPERDLAGPPDGPPPVDVPADGAACMIYTSGSTGAPKGVVVTHRGLANLAAAGAEEFGLRRGDRFLHLASIGFSAALEEVFPALLSGATLLPVGYRRALPSIPHFLDLLERERVTGFEITTSYWHQLVDELAESGAQLPGSLRFVVMGGDRTRPDAVQAWRTTGIPLIHVYGPTEATATGSYHHTAKEEADPAGRLPIGRAIAHTRLHLLDDRMNPVPDGGTGEIYIGGAALARGYHGAPAQTAERFVPDPFTGDGGRLYRTGDVGRRLPDGQFEFLGRVDSQIKIRGFRVEPGEIEAVLQRHQDVAQALVTATAATDADKQLVAYVRPADGARPGKAALRAHLAEALPAHMVPARFVTLDTVPLTGHGKVDYAALERLAAERPADGGGGVPPAPGTETELAALWGAVLKRDTVGATDDFLGLGGNSLQAARIVARTRRRFGVDVVLADLLDAGTVRAMAAKIDTLHGRADGASDPSQTAASGTADAVEAAEAEDRRRWSEKRRSIEQALAGRTGSARTAPVALSQQNLWMLSRAAPDVPLYNESWQCRLTGPLDHTALTGALADLVRRHEPLRTRFGMLDGNAVQYVDEPGEVPLVHHDLTGEPAAARERAAAALRDDIVRVPIDPADGPLFTVHLLRLDATEHLLLVHVHHLVFDGVSKEVFLDDLAALYRSRRTGRPAALPELAFQYGDFALWQRGHLRGERLDGLLDYWRGRLEPAPPPLDWPADRPQHAAEDPRGDKVLLPLGAGLRERVHSLAHEERVTPYMVLLAALAVQLHRHSGQDDLCVGTPAANRLRSGVDGLIGCFINSLPLRVRLRPGMSRRELLHEVRNTCLGALEHQALPFDRLVQELRPPRQPGRSPYFQVWFATEDETALPRESAGVSFTDFQGMTTGLSSGLSKMDLSWIVVDRGHDLVLSLLYRSSLFDQPTVRALADEYRTIVEDIVNEPGAGVVAALDTAPREEAPVVERLLAVWRDAFDQQDIGPDDDFFELGGYSMLAMQLVNAIQEEFGVEVSFTDFFEASTVTGVARLIAEAEPTAPAADPGPRPGPGSGPSLDDMLADAFGD